MAANEGLRALPLLSGLAQRTEASNTSPNCHRCNREFGLLTRRKFCNHCGYSYCGSCCDHQALSPRSDSSHRPGYETVLVCTYCIEMLSITASGKTQLRGMPVGKLKGYLDAYGIQPKSIVEKNDLIEAILDARGLNGCLSAENETYYRRYTIARRNPAEQRNRSHFFSTNQPRTAAPVPPPRPRSTGPRVQTNIRMTSTAPSSPPSRPSAPSSRTSDPPYSQTQYSRPTSPRYERPTSPRQDRGPAASTWSSATAPPLPRSNSAQHGINGYFGMNSNAAPPPEPRWQTRPRSPPPQSPQSPSDTLRVPPNGRSRSRSVPSSEAPELPDNRSRPPPPTPSSPRPRAPLTVPLLSSLLDKSKEDISAYTITTLKGILQANHVNARLILEKSELVEKVMHLVEIERRERAREQAIHEAEERAAIEQQRIRMEQMRLDAERRANTNANSPPYKSQSPPPERPRSPRPAPSQYTHFVERDGLCVVCQDEEANVAIVDCGHLALCMGCSDIIMKSTRECPLCRTRIVTEQRLLRIFKA
ncbi:hypothetical protein CPB86DRAFT_856844 [Serendipita vermifera]|nr:hypothetical protein CPB86DRAFT_856844 [Serendipita vermifera]